MKANFNSVFLLFLVNVVKGMPTPQDPSTLSERQMPSCNAFPPWLPRSGHGAPCGSHHPWEQSVGLQDVAVDVDVVVVVEESIPISEEMSTLSERGLPSCDSFPPWFKNLGHGHGRGLPCESRRPWKQWVGLKSAELTVVESLPTSQDPSVLSPRQLPFCNAFTTWFHRFGHGPACIPRQPRKQQGSLNSAAVQATTLDEPELSFCDDLHPRPNRGPGPKCRPRGSEANVATADALSFVAPSTISVDNQPHCPVGFHAEYSRSEGKSFCVKDGSGEDDKMNGPTQAIVAPAELQADGDEY